MNGASWHGFFLGELWHPLKGLGYQFWSGIAGIINEWLSRLTALGIALGTWWHHHNCIERHCWRKGHPDPEHGHPICRVHKNHPHPAFGGASDSSA